MISRYKLELAGLLCGAAGGFACHHYVGCPNGACVITSSPYISTVYGALMGGLLFSMFKKQTNKKTDLQ
jgi:hypothetical protein